MANLIRIENLEIPRESIESIDYQFKKVKCTKGWGIINITLNDSIMRNQVIEVPDINEGEFDYYCKNINEQLQNV